MTKFSRVFKATLQAQLWMLTQTFLIYLLVVAVSFVFSMFSIDARQAWSVSLMANIAGWSMVFMFIYLVRLIISSKNLMKSNRFRLIPISGNKLYLADICSSWVGLIVVQFIHLVLLLLSFWLAYFTTPDASINGLSWHVLVNGPVISATASGLILTLLSPILIILLVHLIDYISTIFLSYIPGGAQRVVRVLVYIVVIVIVIYVISNVFSVGVSIVNGNFVSGARSVWNMDLFLTGLIIISGSTNMALLHGVETIR
ncbi:hypothetical protein DS830_06265 [Bombilactobacillus bombi]|uniref:hypothetical protein n=1 Tax=Bombilactobacillus bombi TaxID=1303590 RepID=UPI000E57F391|nr:hypothetical protein [Bombilactobacillus bombi]AXX65101.1 hypothetical protein DS830_06265 [Bombilactobacillus bombi]